eukprot:jgi/Mesvir1/25585/Mv01815-RA.3
MAEEKNGDLPLVLILNSQRECEVEKQVLKGVAEVQCAGISDRDVLSGKMEGATVVLLPTLSDMPRAVLKRIRRCKLVICISSPDRAVDDVVAKQLGMTLTHVDVRLVDEMADATCAMILALLRRTLALATKVTGSGWTPSYTYLEGIRRLRGLTLGIAGVDSVARAVASRMRHFGMRILYFDVEKAEDEENRRKLPGGEEAASFRDLLSASDVLTLHCSLTAETHLLINPASLASAKPGLMLVNCCNPQLVDECSLKRALYEKVLGGAAVDAVDGPGWLEAWAREMPNLILTPRSAHYSDDSWPDIRRTAATMALTFLTSGKVPEVDEREVVSTEVLGMNMGGLGLGIGMGYGLDPAVMAGLAPYGSGGLYPYASPSPWNFLGVGADAPGGALSARGPGSQYGIARYSGSAVGGYAMSQTEAASYAYSESGYAPSELDEFAEDDVIDGRLVLRLSGLHHGMVIALRSLAPANGDTPEIPSRRGTNHSSASSGGRELSANGLNGTRSDDGDVDSLTDSSRERHRTYLVARKVANRWMLKPCENIAPQDASAQFLLVKEKGNRFGFRSLVADGALLQVGGWTP